MGLHNINEMRNALLRKENIMKKAYTDAELMQILGADRADSTIIDRKMQEAYEEVRRRSNKNKIIDMNIGNIKEKGAKSGRMRGRKSVHILKKAVGGFGAAVAIFVAAMIFCAANPALAEEIPVLGSIFHAMQGLVTFGGVPEEEITYLREEQNAGANEAGNIGNSGGTTIGQVMQEQNVGAANVLEEPEPSGETALTQYQASDQGLKITLTEYYASNQGISLGVRVESEEPFPEMAVMLAEPRNQLLQFSTTETYSFRDEGDQVVSGFRNLEGKTVDEHTFEGVMRIDYESIKKDFRKYNEAVDKWDYEGYEDAVEKGEPYAEISDDLIEEYDMPESFQMQLAIKNIRIYTYEEKYIVRGDWTFPTTLEIRQSTKDTATIWVNETNEYGWGVEYVEISPTEVTVHSIQPDGSLSIATPIVLDKNNRPLVFGTNGNQFGTYGRDTSVITVYVCDDRINLIKSEAYLPDGTLDEEVYAKLLNEKAQYKKTIDITMYLQEE